MGKYDSWSISKIRKECEDRKIKEVPPKGAVKKNVLIGLLEAYDEEQLVLTPPTPKRKDPFLIPPREYEEEIILEDDVIEPIVDVKNVLSIGIERECPIIMNKQDMLFTGVKGKEDVIWENIVESISPKQLSKIIIFDMTCLVKDDKETIEALIKKNCLDGGEIWIPIKTMCQNYRKGFVRFLEGKKYRKASISSIRFNKSSFEFEIFRCKEEDEEVSVIEKQLSKSLSVHKPKTTFIDSQSLVGEESSPTKKQGCNLEELLVELNEEEESDSDITSHKKDPIVYKKYNIDDIFLSKKNATDENSVRQYESSKISITLPQLVKEIKKNKEFIPRFVESISSLMKHKLKFYKCKIVELKKEFEKVKKKVDELRKNRVSESTIKEKYPLFDFYACFILDLEDIVLSIVEKLCGLKNESVKKDLLEAIENTKKGLNSLVGRDEVKNNLASYLYAFSKSYKVFTNSFNNIALLGGAGVGKTMTAKVISYVFSKSGILATDNVKIVSRADLVGQYVGQTAPRTQSLLLQCLEGVIFIDEAYQLAPPTTTSNDFGIESITEIVNFTDKYIGMSIIIVAGYENIMMRQFFTCNEGLPRRFPFRIILRNYTLNELCDILVMYLESKDIKMKGEDIPNYLYSLIVFISEEKSDVFCNQAGDMLNLGSSIEKCIHSSYSIEWNPSSLSECIPIIKEGFLRFLETKGIDMVSV
jgi:flagellar biosynthesis GTPase FlhF